MRADSSEMQISLEGRPQAVCFLQLFKGMEHGWTLRGDAKDPTVGPNITEAFDRADAWFHKYL